MCQSLYPSKTVSAFTILQPATTTKPYITKRMQALENCSYHCRCGICSNILQRKSIWKVDAVTETKSTIIRTGEHTAGATFPSSFATRVTLSHVWLIQALNYSPCVHRWIINHVPAQQRPSDSFHKVAKRPVSFHSRYRTGGERGSLWKIWFLSQFRVSCLFLWSKGKRPW